MNYTSTGTFNIKVPKIINALNRALFNKTKTVNVFINNDKMSIHSFDISGNIVYLLREQNITKNDMRTSKNSQKAILPTELNEEVLEKIFDQVSFNLDSSALSWEEDNELSGSQILEEMSKKIDQEEEEFFSLDSDKDLVNSEYDIDTDPIMKDSFIIDLGDECCRFSTPLEFVKTLSLFEDVSISLSEHQVVIQDIKSKTKITLPKYECYTELEDISNLVKYNQWELFPAKTVKGIIPLIDKIQPNKLNQKVSIKDGQLFLFSDTIAVTSKVKRTFDEYCITPEVLRILRYSYSKMNDVYFSIKDKKLSIDIDGLLIVFPYSNKEIGIDLFDLLNEDKKITEFELNKDFQKALTIMENIGKLKITNINFGKNYSKLYGENIETISETKSPIIFDASISTDTLKLMLKLIGKTNPTVSIYKLSHGRYVITLNNKDLKILAEFNSLKEK